MTFVTQEALDNPTYREHNGDMTNNTQADNHPPFPRGAIAHFARQIESEYWQEFADRLEGKDGDDDTTGYDGEDFFGDEIMIPAYDIHYGNHAECYPNLDDADRAAAAEIVAFRESFGDDW